MHEMCACRRKVFEDMQTQAARNKMQVMGTGLVKAEHDEVRAFCSVLMALCPQPFSALLASHILMMQHWQGLTVLN